MKITNKKSIILLHITEKIKTVETRNRRAPSAKTPKTLHSATIANFTKQYNFLSNYFKQNISLVFYKDLFDRISGNEENFCDELELCDTIIKGADGDWLDDIIRAVPDGFKIDYENKIVLCLEVEHNSRLKQNKLDRYAEIARWLDDIGWTLGIISIDAVTGNQSVIDPFVWTLESHCGQEINRISALIDSGEEITQEEEANFLYINNYLQGHRRFSGFDSGAVIVD